MKVILFGGNSKDMEWNYNMEEAPLDVPIKLLSADDCPLLPQREYIGTITNNGSYLTRGECIVGDPDYFYRSAIIAWMYIDKYTLWDKAGTSYHITKADIGVRQIVQG